MKKGKDKTELTMAQKAKIDEWWSQVNVWKVPKEFKEVPVSQYGDGKDHIRVMYHIFELMEQAMKSR